MNQTSRFTAHVFAARRDAAKPAASPLKFEKQVVRALSGAELKIVGGGRRLECGNSRA